MLKQNILQSVLRIHGRLSTILKRSSKNVWSYDFWQVKVYIFWKFIQYTIYWDETEMLKKFQRNKKCTLFFLWLAPTYHSVTFNSQFFYELKNKVHLSQTVCGIFNFQFRLVLIKVLFFSSAKNMASLTLNRHNSFQNKNNRKATDSFAPRPLIFKLQQEVLKFNDIWVSWSSPKTDLETNFVDVENQSLSTSLFVNSNF